MRRRDKQPPRTKKYYRSTKSGAGMTKAGVARYRRENPGSKLKTAVTKKTGLTMKDIERLREDVEKLKDKVRENGNGYSSNNVSKQ